MRAKRRFQLVLIKPSHYDDDGYVIQWFRSWIPANSLAVLYGLADDAARRQVLGPDIAFDIEAVDELNTRVKIDDIIARFQRHQGFGLVGLVGVQSNQFPRSLDIARPLRAAGIPVVIGGFHVSGCLAMLPELPADMQSALDMGCSLFAGEGEDGAFDQVLRDTAGSALAPVYNLLDRLPALQSAPLPFLPPRNIKRTAGFWGSFDAGRGCPFQCSFCTIINVQGRKSRHRTADDVERLVRLNLRHGFYYFFITDDNFARNKDWEPIFDRLIELREREGIELLLMIQVDLLCHKIPNFIEKAERAGVRQVFIGLESINPANLQASKKRQNRITEYRATMLAWKRARAVIYAGYILGFPDDTPESIREDIEIIKQELPLDILEFFCFTPLPGSEDHKVLWQKGVWMDPDMNKYDTEHVVMRHPRMNHDEWEAVYRSAWDAYFTLDHIETILRRTAVFDGGVSYLSVLLFMCSRCVQLEKINPVQGGAFRRKYRRDRRPGLPREPVWTFYPQYAWNVLWKSARMAAHALAVDARRRRVRSDPERHSYMDRALLPLEDETETFQLFTHSVAARGEIERVRKIAALTRSPAS